MEKIRYEDLSVCITCRFLFKGSLCFNHVHKRGDVIIPTPALYVCKNYTKEKDK